MDRSHPTGAQRQTGRPLIKILSMGVLGFTLAACEMGATNSADATADRPVAMQKATRLVDRDVEAPDVFQITETALWDGRPSLGGVWVAAPDVKDPERVIMRNPANGKFVIGALFRREVGNPGPKLQISSDAAEALGMLAGAPTRLSVIALRREEQAIETPTTPILDTAEPRITAPAANDKITSQALDAPAPTSGLSTTPPKAAGTPNAKPTPAEKPAVAPAPTPAKPVAAGKTIQVGIFSVEQNATRAQTTLTKAGVKAEINKNLSKGKEYWSLTTRGDAAVLSKVKAAGFKDAYVLK